MASISALMLGVALGTRCEQPVLAPVRRGPDLLPVDEPVVARLVAIVRRRWPAKTAVEQAKRREAAFERPLDGGARCLRHRSEVVRRARHRALGPCRSCCFCRAVAEYWAQAPSRTRPHTPCAPRPERRTRGRSRA